MKQNDALAYLYKNINGVGRKLADICNTVLKDERFQIYPASIDKHHAYSGGLVVHTAEVLEIAMSMARSQGLLIDTNVLIPAAIFHDFGKVHDYGIYNYAKYDLLQQHKFETNELSVVDAASIWGKASHRHTIRHPARSYSDWLKATDGQGIDAAFEEKVAHCILSHHGRVEWNSPVEPQSVEAYVLHFADMLSAKYGETSQNKS
jgi:3'-5' exoribonuclease